jgi:hypothetical protein
MFMENPTYFLAKLNVGITILIEGCFENRCARRWNQLVIGLSGKLHLKELLIPET